jgi:hypothetical protein
MKTVFSGVSKSGNASLRRLAKSLQWRQLYQNSDEYLLEWTCEEPIRLRQVLNGETCGVGTGANCWPAANVLARYLLQRYGETGLSGLRAIDVGAGTGAVGICAALLGATVTLTDQKNVRFLMEDNAVTTQKRFGLPDDQIRVEVLDWDASVARLGPPFDLVLVSDCILPKLYPIEPLVRTLAALLCGEGDGKCSLSTKLNESRSPPPVALVSYEHRPFHLYDPRSEFRRLLSNCSLRVIREVPLAEQDPVYCSEEITIFEIGPAS